MKYLLGNLFCRIADSNDAKRLASQPEPKGVSKYTYDYLDDGNIFHKLNVYRVENENDGLSPVIIDIHGGGWYYGDRELNRNFDRRFALNGYTVVSISYRLIDKGVTFVEQLQDVFSSFKWVEDNAKEQKFDLNNLFLMGDSAGAHLAGMALNCIGDREMASVFGVSSGLRFNAVNFTCGAFKPTALAKLPIIHSFIKPVIKNKKSKYYKYVDIVANMPDEYPPINMVTCDGDFLKGMVLKAREEIDKKGLDYELIYLDKETAGGKNPHVFNVLYPDEGFGGKVNSLIDDFFKRHLN